MNDLITNAPAREGRSPRPPLISRQRQDKMTGRMFFVFSLVPVILAVVILGMLTIRTWPILRSHSMWALLAGKIWKPEEGLFGFWPFIAGTGWVTITSVILAVPPCLLTAIYLSEYARHSTRLFMKPLLDILAAIPSVVYGVWGVVVIVPFVGNTLSPTLSHWLGFIPLFQTQNPTGYSIISAAIVLAVMIAPFIIAITYEVMNAVPNGLRQASLAVGATRWQTVRHAVLPQIIPGLLAGIVLGLSRALGETMAVLMVVGNVIHIPGSLFDAAYPLPALIANNFGDMMSIPLYDAALMGAALILLLIVLVFNIVSALILQRVLGRRWM